MSDQTKGNDPGAIWRNQPEEKLRVNLEQIVNRRTAELHSSTRAEILMSIGAALLLVGVVAWRIAPARDPVGELGFAAVIAWVVTTLFAFRRRIFGREPSRPDTVAATGLEYYRRQLEWRRDHLRNAWLWHGPLVLACTILVAIMARKASFAAAFTLPLQGPRNVLPLLILLAVWTGFGAWRRRLQARELQREIDGMEPRGPA
jgi:hypothetical protein